MTGAVTQIPSARRRKVDPLDVPPLITMRATSGARTDGVSTAERNPSRSALLAAGAVSDTEPGSSTRQRGGGTTGATARTAR